MMGLYTNRWRGIEGFRLDPASLGPVQSVGQSSRSSLTLQKWRKHWAFGGVGQ